MMKLLSSVLVLLAILTSPSAQALEVGVLGGLNFWSPSASSGLGSITTSAGSNLAAGAYVQKGFNPLFDVELGLMYVKKKADLTLLGSVSSSSYNAIQIPLILRTGFIPGNFFNVGAGAYYETVSGGTPSGQKSSDYGLVGSAQVRFPLAPLTKFIVDARYLMGLSEQSTDTTNISIKNRGIEVLAGLSFGI